MCHPHGPGEPLPRPGVLRQDVSFTLGDGERLSARVCLPKCSPWGAVVIATDIYGSNRFYKGIAERLAEAGCAAILPDLFRREGPLSEVTREAAFDRRAKLDDARAVAEIGTALAWLETESGASGATLGFCLGGNLALHGTTQHEVGATVCYYAFPGGLPAPRALPPPLKVVDALRGPILALWGEDDVKVGMENVEAFRVAVEARGLDYEQRVYPGVEHGFLAGLDEDVEHQDHAPALDSWNRTLAFLRQHLEMR